LVAFFSAQLCPLRKPAGRKGRTKTTFLGAKKILKTGRENVGLQNVDVDGKQGIHSVVLCKQGVNQSIDSVYKEDTY